MNRTATFTGTILLVAGFVATATAAPEPERRGPGAEHGDRFERMAQDRCAHFKERLASVDRGLTAEQLRDIAQGQLAARDLTNLKVGKVTEKDGVVTLEIVTKDGSLVETRQISTKTGLDPSAGTKCEENMRRRAEARPEGAFGRSERRGRGEFGRGPSGHRGPGGPGGPGMDRPGMGALGPLPGGQGRGRDLELSADDVKKLAEAALVLQGNDRLKVGKVTEKDADTYAVDIVTRENSLVVTREVNKHSGRWSRS